MKPYLILLLPFLIPSAFADEREVTPKQQAAIAGANDTIPDAKLKRPANLREAPLGDNLSI